MIDQNIDWSTDEKSVNIFDLSLINQWSLVTMLSQRKTIAGGWVVHH